MTASRRVGWFGGVYVSISDIVVKVAGFFVVEPVMLSKVVDESELLEFLLE